MIGEQDSFDAEATPVVGKIREGGHYLSLQLEWRL